jgi:hypothetical protein
MFTNDHDNKAQNTDHHRLGGNSIVQAEMQARLAFRQQLKSRMSIRCVSNESCQNCCAAYLALLSTLPSIGMSQDKVDIVLDRFPKFWRVGVMYVCVGTLIKVSHEIPEDLDSRLILG